MLKNNPVSSVNSLKDTIRSDYQVYRWFLFLIMHKRVKPELLKIVNISQLYKELHAKTVQLNLYLLLSIALVFGAFFTGVYLVLIAAFLILGISIRVYGNKKEIVSCISMLLMLKDFDESKLILNTLYQIGEFYSNKYKIISITDLIYHTDHISRKMLVVIILMGMIVFIIFRDIKITDTLIFSVGLYWFLYAATHSSTACRYLKEN